MKNATETSNPLWLTGEAIAYGIPTQNPDCNQDSDPAPDLLPDTPQDHRTAMQEFEKRLIVRALEQNNWHREKAAQRLKIPRRTFYRKLKNLGLFPARIVPFLAR